MSLREDNMYPTNGGYYATEPVEQVQERNQERDSVLSNAPQIQDAINNLRAQADLYETVYAIPDELLLTDEKAAVNKLAINKGIAIGLRAEADKLDVQLKAYTED